MFMNQHITQSEEVIKNKRLKVLLLAYACEPNRGSEPGTGWNIALSMAKLNDVTVITRANNQGSIEVALESMTVENRPRFLYTDPPAWALWLKSRRFLPVQVFYNLWQRETVKRLEKSKDFFDIIHQLTFNSFEVPPRIFNYSRSKKIWGPVGGGQTVKLGLLRAFGLFGGMKEAFRNLRVSFSSFAPWTRATLRNSDLVLFANHETKNLLSNACACETSMMIDVGVNCDAFDPPLRSADLSKIVLISAGRLEPRKGISLLIRAFRLVVDQLPNIELRIVGEGPLRESLEKLARKLHLSSQIIFTGAVDHVKMRNEYSNADVFVFPSLRDTSGAVVLEAMAMALPVICFEHQGASLMVDSRSGIRVPVTTYRDSIIALSEAIKKLSSDSQARTILGLNGRSDALKRYDWNAKAARINDFYHSIIETS